MLTVALLAALPHPAASMGWFVFRGKEHWAVGETTTFAHSQRHRSGDVRVTLDSRTREGWSDLTVTTLWSDRNKQSVRLWQNPDDGELKCVWVKGTEMSHTFDPPLTIFPGRHALPGTFRVTPTMRPFGFCRMAQGKSLGYIAPELTGSATKATGEATWPLGDASWPVDRILRGEYKLRAGEVREEGFAGGTYDRVTEVAGKESLFERTRQGEKLVSETTIDWSWFSS